MPEDFANSTNGKKRSAPADDEVNSSKRHAPRAAYKSLKDTDFDAISHGGRFSDLVLKFREDTWKVHKYVLCTQSDFFGGCVESGMRESIENIIELKDEDLELEDIRRMLEFLYTGDFWEHPEEDRHDGLTSCSELPYHNHARFTLGEDQPQRTDDEKRKDPLTVLFRMSAIADKFGISGLQNAIVRKMEYFRDLNTAKLPVPEELMEVKHCGSNFLGNWQRILDAIEFCCADLGSQPHIDKLADILLCPIARMAPILLGMKSDKTIWFRRQDLWRNVMEENNSSWWFRDLQRRLEANPSLCSRMFKICCFEAFSTERERSLDSFTDEQHEKRQEIEKTLHMIALVLRQDQQHMEEGDRLRCRRNEMRDANETSYSDHDLCNSYLPMVPFLGSQTDSESRSLIAFKCLECCYVAGIEEVIGEPMSLEELEMYFPVKTVQ